MGVPSTELWSGVSRSTGIPIPRLQDAYRMGVIGDEHLAKFAQVDLEANQADILLTELKRRRRLQPPSSLLLPPAALHHDAGAGSMDTSDDEKAEAQPAKTDMSPPRPVLRRPGAKNSVSGVDLNVDPFHFLGPRPDAPFLQRELNQAKAWGVKAVVTNQELPSNQKVYVQLTVGQQCF
jgi:hypothetical protein